MRMRRERSQEANIRRPSSLRPEREKLAYRCAIVKLNVYRLRLACANPRSPGYKSSDFAQGGVHKRPMGDALANQSELSCERLIYSL
jgi:hypothetical protein